LVDIFVAVCFHAHCPKVEGLGGPSSQPKAAIPLPVESMAAPAVANSASGRGLWGDEAEGNPVVIFNVVFKLERFDYEHCRFVG
jgi:hypothetical protein